MNPQEALLELADDLIDQLWEKVQIFSEANMHGYLGGTPVQFLASRIEAYRLVRDNSQGVSDEG